MTDGIPGRVSVSGRALEAVFAAVAADRLAVRPRDVAARVTDDAGRVGVRVTGPARHERGDPDLVETGRRARDAVVSDGGRIAGVEVGSVTVRITGARESRRRVR